MSQLRAVSAHCPRAACSGRDLRFVRDGRKVCSLSIDLEDFLHDYQRSLGVRQPRHDVGSLDKAYCLLDEFSRSRLDGARLTFFTTGQVARDYPDLVRRIAADGHEIGCHHYEHDQIWHQDRGAFRSNLQLAIECLSSASGQNIMGFRAPDFSIDGRCADWAYEELARHFLYDSSLVAVRHAALPGRPLMLRFSGAHLNELALYKRRIMPGVTVRVMGGTYMRLLPEWLILDLLREAWDRGFVPQVYLHPYDILHDYAQWSTYADLADLPVSRRLYRWARQVQWHSIGNRSIWRKLAAVYEEFAHPGPMSTLLGVSRPASVFANATSSN